MLVYFSGSAREIERDIEVYRAIVGAIQTSGGNLVHNWIEAASFRRHTSKDASWWQEVHHEVEVALKSVDYVVIEATGQSVLGVGYEMAQALSYNKPVLALVRKDTQNSYVVGLKHQLLQVVYYTQEELEGIIDSFLRERDTMRSAVEA